jgi:hypothetical protein
MVSIRSRWLAACLGGFLLAWAAWPACGTVIIGPQTWDQAAQGLQGWTNEYGSSTLVRQGAGGNPAGWLQIAFAPISPDTPPGTNWYDLLYAPASNLFAGSWSTQMWVQFDFWASNQVPNQLALRWQSFTNSYIWSHGFSVVSTQSWITLSSSLLDWEDWVLGPGASEDMFLADLSSINWIGVYIERPGPGAQIYGLDNFGLMVPEPSEWAMLAAAALSAWSIYRRRRPPRGLS